MARITVFLVDGSGSMEPAWGVAWRSVFEEARSERVGLFSILVFKHSNMFGVTPELAKHVVARFGNAVVLSVARLLAEKGVRKISVVPRPDDVGLQFAGRTPLNDAVIATIRLLESSSIGGDYVINVVTDNRDTASLSSMRDVLAEKSCAKKLRGIYVVPVGDFLPKYLDIYDNAQEVAQRFARRESILDIVARLI